VRGGETIPSILASITSPGLKVILKKKGGRGRGGRERKNEVARPHSALFQIFSNFRFFRGGKKKGKKGVRGKQIDLRCLGSSIFFAVLSHLPFFSLPGKKKRGEKEGSA